MVTRILLFLVSVAFVILFCRDATAEPCLHVQSTIMRVGDDWKVKGETCAANSSVVLITPDKPGGKVLRLRNLAELREGDPLHAAVKGSLIGCILRMYQEKKREVSCDLNAGVYATPSAFEASERLKDRVLQENRGHPAPRAETNESAAKPLIDTPFAPDRTIKSEDADEGWISEESLLLLKLLGLAVALGAAGVVLHMLVVRRQPKITSHS